MVLSVLRCDVSTAAAPAARRGQACCAPGLLRSSPAVAQRQLRGYLDEITRTDISRVDGIARDPAGVRMDGDEPCMVVSTACRLLRRPSAIMIRFALYSRLKSYHIEERPCVG